MGFFNGLTLTLLTIAPLTMYFTQSQLRQLSAPSQLMRLVPLMVLAVAFEILKGSLSGNLTGALFGESAPDSVKQIEEFLTVAISAIIDILIIHYLVISKVPRRALKLESDENTEDVGGLCPPSLTCHIQCAFGAAFWLVRFASPMVANIRGTPGSDPNFLAAAIICNLQFIFIAVVVSIAARGSANNSSVDAVVWPLVAIVVACIAGSGILLPRILPGGTKLGTAFLVVGAQVVGAVIFRTFMPSAKPVTAAKAKVQ